jgi:hypothetical protein
MATEGDYDAWQVLAGEDLSGALHKCVTATGKIAQAGAATYPELPLGVAKSKAASGESVRVATEGIVKAFVGLAVTTIGWPLGVANSGWLVPTSFASVGSSQGIVTARFLGPSAAASGDLATIFLTP